MKTESEPLSIELSTQGRRGIRYPEVPQERGASALGTKWLRAEPAKLPELSELETVRHFTRLSQLNYSIDTNFYPLGSCTMKYNPKVNEALALEPALAGAHPMAPEQAVQGTLELLHGLERGLSELCGMDAFTLQPAAGAHGELVGVLVTRAYHKSRGDDARTEILIPDSAHGTNPASAALGGFTVSSVPSDARGRVDVAKLKERLGPKTALVMMTVPNTLGLFEENIVEIADAVHKAGALLYMDGANFNALIGLVRPGDFGVDLLHLNLHKTFSTPHGGGGPGAGPLGVKKHLEAFLPGPRVVKSGDGFKLDAGSDKSIGRVRAFYGNTGVLVRAYAYFRRHGPDSFKKIAEAAILNANYVKARLQAKFRPFVDEPCMHECILQTEPSKLNGVKTLDVAKRLLDHGCYAPTVYFPLIVPECMMIEPTETESKRTIDAFIASMLEIADEAASNPDVVKTAPHTTPVRRLDEVKAAREPNLRWP
jgi:glycine dehydrogenase subunit 2